MAAHALGLVYLCQGDFDRAIPVLERALRSCEVNQIPLGTRLLASALGYAYSLTGRVTDGVALLEQAVRQAEALKVVFRYALWLAWVGEAYLLAGRATDALELARRAVERASANKEPGHEASALRLIGQIATSAEPPGVTQAEQAYGRASALADELGMRPLIAHCHLGLGQLSRRTGKREQAQGHLATAVTMYREMGMTYWPEKAEAEMRSVA